jgi:hypothetical protein
MGIVTGRMSALLQAGLGVPKAVNGMTPTAAGPPP